MVDTVGDVKSGLQEGRGRREREEGGKKCEDAPPLLGQKIELRRKRDQSSFQTFWDSRDQGPFQGPTAAYKPRPRTKEEQKPSSGTDTCLLTRQAKFKNSAQILSENQLTSPVMMRAVSNKIVFH